MTKIRGIDHVQICIPIGEEEKARNFYGGLLGLQEIEKPDSLKANGGVWYQVGDLELHIGTEKMNQEKGKRHVAFRVDDIQAMRTLLENHGFTINEEKPIPGAERFSIRDPFGNRMEFISRNTSI
jgi:catechol 2,3-dioxygenase-like lactoylglutathione lyase family enzyme